MLKVFRLTVTLSLLLMGTLPVSADSDLSVFSGKTMGTTYQVKVVPEKGIVSNNLHHKIEDRLSEINNSMSTFLPGSEISRFNAFQVAEKPFPVSKDFLKVMQVAGEVFRFTDGAWDGTVKPMVDLWGFGTSGNRTAPPTQDEIRSALQRVGFHQIQISESGYLVKKKPGVTLDLASIAKGYGVDALAALVRESGFRRFLVEIGGEVYASGLKKDGSPWRIGINEPKADAPANQVRKVVNLTEAALATSGDYRNFFEKSGIRYSHVIDPRTGYPVSNGIVSASVLAKSCTFADGLATALMVMGPDQGIFLVHRLESVECLLMVQNQDGSIREIASNGFTKAASD